MEWGEGIDHCAGSRRGKRVPAGGGHVVGNVIRHWSGHGTEVSEHDVRMPLADELDGGGVDVGARVERWRSLLWRGGVGNRAEYSGPFEVLFSWFDDVRRCSVR